MERKNKVTLVGRPFAPIGMGELPRLIFRALRAVGLKAEIRDVEGVGTDDPDVREEFANSLTQEFSPHVNLFCLNGDEIDYWLRRLSTQLPRDAFNIVYPFWELSKYPAVWAEQLSKFDEVWTASAFIRESIAAAVNKPVLHVSEPGEIKLKSFLGRRYFGIPESSFVFLFFFDFTSYLERKNPFAALRAFDELCRRNPNDDLFLVIKVKGGEEKKNDRDRFYEYINRYKGQLVVIDKLLSDNEVKNLVRCCDCFLSLHRSEGFGLGLITAMYLGKPVIATGYSGNADFMTEENSCPVRYSLCDVPHWAYPFAEGQVWAEPDVAHAVDHMARLVSNRNYALRIGENASRHIRTNFSCQAVGLRYLNRIREILALRKGSSEVSSAALTVTAAS